MPLSRWVLGAPLEGCVQLWHGWVLPILPRAKGVGESSAPLGLVFSSELPPGQGCPPLTPALSAPGLPGDAPLVQVLEEESRSRLGHFNQKDVSMVFSSVMRLHPAGPHPLVESCLGCLERLTPYTMALIAKYVARHRLREPQLLDSIADFLLKRTEQLDSKLIQKLVFPFSRMNYRPSNHSELFPKLEAVLEQKGAASPLATVNILMSLFQLRHFPSDVLRQVFSPVFLATVTSSPHAQIVRRYLSLLDAAVALEFQAYSGPRLDPRYRVRMFDRALTADEANRKYSYKGLVAEALRQLVGEECYRQDEVLSPGYCTGIGGVCLWGGDRGHPTAWALTPPHLCLGRFPAVDEVVLSVNDKWHYSQNTDILVGSRAMRNRHLQMLGYWVVQVGRPLPYTELEKVSGIEEAKQYLCQKLRELRF
uniref:Fas activated serine/threonine kinase n=1 Tax=Sphenodon punctatus TaxID=8508 RepID=A0A8D0L4P1_SPHPU